MAEPMDSPAGTFRVACSPLTNAIYAGRTNKAATKWTSKSDVTGEACAAVAKHVLAEHGGAMTLRAADGSGWDIEVMAVQGSTEEER